MSESNQAGRGRSRERLAEERRRQAAKERRRRQLVVAGVVVVVIGLVVGIGVAIQSHRANQRSADYVAAPAGATSGQSVLYGKADAPVAMTIYQDYRCPFCAQFESQFGSTVTDLVNSGKLKVNYHLVRLIDFNAKPAGIGSLNSANAALCAQDAGKFGEINSTLYASQPGEASDPWANKAAVIDVARKVPGLVNPAFEACVNSGRHDAEVNQMWDYFQKTYGGKGVSTPTVILRQDELLGATRGATSNAAYLASPEALRAEVNAEAAGTSNNK